ncbi:hypothetical protein OH779_04775 [Actinacidiphila glaucinigra]|uniref:hypothetical protein n=1 Tax=Actinacidiphila glaucinigra TaxID=235986 RepID=UPI00386C700C
MRADWVEEYVGRKYLEAVGRFREYVDISHGGYDTTSELEDVQEELSQHMKDRDLFESKAGQQEWRDRAAALETRLATLEVAEAIPPRVERVYSDRTFADGWNATDDPLARRALLLAVGARVVLSTGAVGDVSGLDESRLTFSVGQHVDPEADALEDAAYQASLRRR